MAYLRASRLRAARRWSSRGRRSGGRDRGGSPRAPREHRRPAPTLAVDGAKFAYVKGKGDSMSQENSSGRPSTLPTPLVLAIALTCALVVMVGCGSSRGYSQPAATTTSVGAQINQSTQGLTVDGLVEYGYSIPHRYRSQGSGQLAVDP